jgi:hypothetical protein
VVERLAPLFRRVDGYFEVLFIFILPDEVTQGTGAETGIERRVLGAGLTRDDTSYSLTP